MTHNIWHKIGMGLIGMLLTALIAVVGYAGRTLLQNQQRVIETQSMLVERSGDQSKMLQRLMSDHDKLTNLAGVVQTHGYEIKLNSDRINRLEK